MKLEEFLQDPSCSKYKKEAEKYKDEFISEGCEIFLWTHYADEKKAHDFTRELAKKKGKLKTNPYIAKFIKQLSFIDEEHIAFIYSEQYSASYLMAQAVAKTAIMSYVIDNIFPEDDTKNWIAIFSKKDKKSIGMMFHIVYSIIPYTADTYGGYKLFRKGLMYYADCLQYDGQLLEPEWPKPLAHFQGNTFRRDTNPKIILESRKVTKMLIRLGYFNDEYEIFYNLWNVLLPFLQTMYDRAEIFIRNNNSKWEKDVKNLQSQMVADGIIVSKWKSEQKLFALVKKEYPDAIYQYQPIWLEPQSLDIYIPSLNIGIEYQGIQHYKSVDFFGGEEAFIHRKHLDDRKKNLCLSNGLKLIVWAYTDYISIKNLKNKIEDKETDQITLWNYDSFENK